jgi:hypothetical protein
MHGEKKFKNLLMYGRTEMGLKLTEYQIIYPKSVSPCMYHVSIGPLFLTTHVVGWRINRVHLAKIFRTFENLFAI